MCPAKKKQKTAALFPALARLLAFVRGQGRPIVWTVLLVVGLVGGWCGVWYGAGVRQYVLSSDEYLVTPQSVQIPPLPDWINNSQIRNEVFRDASLDGPLSIMDDDLTERIGNAFSLHPWIAKVCWVRKHHPARVEVELIYRRPVCMVEVPGGLFPVDSQGVLLPAADFSPIEASRYPRLVSVDTLPMGTAGECWGDPRVVGGAEIATALGEAWQELRLAQILPSTRPAAGVMTEHTYTLVTRRGTQIYWGPAPGSGVPGELPAAEKVALLQKYVQEHGTLEGHHGPQELDVRRLQTPRVSSR